MSEVKSYIGRKTIEQSDIDRIRANWPNQSLPADDFLRAALSAYLLEYLIWQWPLKHRSDENNLHLGIWLNDELIELDSLGGIADKNEHAFQLMDLILYKADVPELAFAGRSANPFCLWSQSDLERFLQFGECMESGYDFLDMPTMTVASAPNLDLASSAAISQFEAKFSSAEYETLVAAWQQVTRYSRGQLLCHGPSVAKIAKRVEPELRRFSYPTRYPLDPHTCWMDQQVQAAVFHYRSLETSQRHRFDRRAFSELFFGGLGVESRKIAKEAWPSFLSELERGNDNYLSYEEGFTQNSFYRVAAWEFEKLKRRGRK